MTWELAVHNRQRRWRLDTRRLRTTTIAWLTKELRLSDWQLGIHIVGATAMARLNRQWLSHEGSTDVLTFDHRVHPDEPLYGELFISIDDAAMQSRTFGTTPEQEIVRYVIHGVLHLQGHDDQVAAARKAMKREEDRWVRRIAARYPLSGWVRPAPRRAA